jgi:hypothetical protein
MQSPLIPRHQRTTMGANLKRTNVVVRLSEMLRKNATFTKALSSILYLLPKNEKKFLAYINFSHCEQ